MIRPSRSIASLLLTLLVQQSFTVPAFADAVTPAPPTPTSPSPALVGWGGLFVPGLGAALMGQPVRGLLEAGTDLGLYFGATSGTQQGTFTIDGSTIVPNAANIGRPLSAQFFQEIGLKLHFYYTFYHYQQAALLLANSDREKSNPQPLYTGSAGDILLAPFKWKNLSSVWVYPLILVSTAYLLVNYNLTPVQNLNFTAQPTDNLFYGVNQIGVIPLGSGFGEEPLFRGFIQREARLYTGSVALSLLWQSTMFTVIHPDSEKLTAFLSAIYFGLMTNYYKGDFEPAIAAHFWVDVVYGLVTYWTFIREQGQSTPFAPPVTMQLSIPF